MAQSAKSGVTITNLTLEEKKALCEAWSKSNLSRSEFIRRNNLPRTFHYWCNKLLSGGKEALGVTTTPVVTAIKAKHETELTTGNNKQNWVRVSSSKLNLGTQKTTDAIPDLTELQLILGDIRLNLHLPMAQLVNFIKELRDAATVIR